MTSQWVVIKFGGTSVSSRESWSKIAQIVNQRLQEGFRVLVVCSAPSGVSNKLEKLALAKASETTVSEIKQQYQALTEDLRLDASDHLSPFFLQLADLLEDLDQKAQPEVHARIMSLGELMLTRLGADYLCQQSIETCWQDARSCLLAETPANSHHPDAWLNVHCSADRNPELEKKFNALQGVIITQGFIASNAEGKTVLLGRGGSDTSAAYFASQLGAVRCEIWTDVPGIYTANPRQIPQARMIRHLDYDEAQEIASMGAKVLHPRCISPVSANQIPIQVRYTLKPEREGTEIGAHLSKQRSQIKSILIKQDVVLILIETLDMWHQVGFMSEVFACFQHHGISIDLVSTSQAAVTVSLDSTVHSQNPAILDALLQDLNQFANAKIIAPCASVSLVGRNIRSILHQLGEVFTVFEAQKVYLLSQAANDLNLTFVVDEEQALRLAVKLHHLLIEQKQVSEPFQLSWAEEFGDKNHQPVLPWWQQQRQRLLALVKTATPQYVYSQARLQRSMKDLQACDAVDQFFYSIKANSHADILREFYAGGLGFESVSIQELDYLLDLFPDIDRKRLLFTPNFAERSEYARAVELGVWITIDNLHPLQHWGELFRGHSVLIRVDIGKGSGHHKHVVTGGDQSKFGIPLKYLEQVKTLTQQYDITVKGLHSHAGSGILDANHWQSVFTSLASLLEQFPAVEIINVGGGLGIVERPGQQPLDLSVLNDSLKTAKSNSPALTLWMEPGRYLVAEAGVLLTTVTQTKNKGDLQFVGVDTGMNSLIRPALYGSYHEIVNLTRIDEPKTLKANVVGPICETGDTLGYSRYLPPCQEGDVVLVANAGAYGYTMSSRYNLRLPAVEYYLIKNDGFIPVNNDTVL